MTHTPGSPQEAPGPKLKVHVAAREAPGESTADYFQRGLALLADGDAACAVTAFRKAIAADAADVEAHHGLIRALRDSDQFEEAIKAAEELIQLTPDDPLAQASLSIALQKAGRIPEAEAAAARARILEWKQQLAEPDLDSDSQSSSLNESQDRRSATTREGL